MKFSFIMFCVIIETMIMAIDTKYENLSQDNKRGMGRILDTLYKWWINYVPDEVK